MRQAPVRFDTAKAFGFLMVIVIIDRLPTNSTSLVAMSTGQRLHSHFGSITIQVSLLPANYGTFNVMPISKFT